MREITYTKVEVVREGQVERFGYVAVIRDPKVKDEYEEGEDLSSYLNQDDLSLDDIVLFITNDKDCEEFFATYRKDGYECWNGDILKQPIDQQVFDALVEQVDNEEITSLPELKQACKEATTFLRAISWLSEVSDSGELEIDWDEVLAEAEYNVCDRCERLVEVGGDMFWVMGYDFSDEEDKRLDEILDLLAEEGYEALC